MGRVLDEDEFTEFDGELEFDELELELGEGVRLKKKAADEGEGIVRGASGGGNESRGGRGGDREAAIGGSGIGGEAVGECCAAD